MTSMCQGLSSFAPGGGKMRDPGNEVVLETFHTDHTNNIRLAISNVTGNFKASKNINTLSQGFH